MLKFYIAFTIASLITLILTIKKYKKIYKELSEIEVFSSFGMVIVGGIIRSFIPIYHIYMSFMNMVIFSLDDKEMEKFINFCKEDSNEV